MKTIPVVFVAFLAFSASVSGKQRNIVIIQADDVGFYDLSHRGSTEIPTPNLDALAYNGIIMDRFYTAPLCTPSRGAAMTGKYPHHIGLQNNVMWNDEPWGLGLEEKLFPEYFKEAGYGTHLIGKWHLGFHKEEYTPLRRGFDTHFGFYGPWTDYFSHKFYMADRNYTVGLDLHNNLGNVNPTEYEGEYATDLYTRKAIEVINNQSKDKPFLLLLNHLACHTGNDNVPLQAKPEDLARFPNITNPQRKLYAAMLYALDQSIGKIISALDKADLLKNTLVFYYNDNGGATAIQITKPTTANNFPLRSQKGLGWEGGIRVNGILYAPFLPRKQIRNKLFHVTDLLPTFASLADSDVVIDREIDGLDLSEMILEDEGPFRNEIIVTDNIFGISSLIYKQWKLVNGTFVPLRGLTDNWFGTNPVGPITQSQYIDAVLNSETGITLRKYNKSVREKTILRTRAKTTVKCLGVRTACNLLVAPCLYDIENDPCEENNVADLLPEVLADMKARFNAHVATSVPTRNKAPDARCDPARFGNNWTWWAQDIVEYS